MIENRQQLGSDKHLVKSGLLVWHIDETITDMYPTLNSVNVNPDFYGVNLIQADGDGDLYGSSGSDAGDPFPDRQCAREGEHADEHGQLPRAPSACGEVGKESFQIDIQEGICICVHGALDGNGGNTAACLVADLCGDDSRLAVYWCSLYSPT